jgi:WD40 repeat protein
VIDDCYRFVLGFFDVIEESAMHIYHSALPWSPTSSLIRKLYQKHITTEVKLVNAIDAHWNSYIRTIPVRNSINQIVFSHGGSALAVVSRNHVEIFETATGLATFELDERVISVAFTPDNDMLVGGFSDGSVRIWDVQTKHGVQSFVGHVKKVLSVAFSPCGTMIVSGSLDKTVRIWNISSGSCKCVLEGHEDRVSAVCWSVTGDRVISGSWDSSVRVWDVSRQTCLMVLCGHTRGISSVASSCDSPLIASGSMDGTVQVYDAWSGNVIKVISTGRTVPSIQFSTYRDQLLFTNPESATIWDLTTDMILSTIDCHGYCTAFSSDGTRAASWLDSFVKIQDAKNGFSNFEPVEQVDNCHVAGAIISVRDRDNNPDSDEVKIMASGSIKFWDRKTSDDCAFTFDHHYIEPVKFRATSSFVACVYDNSYAQVWNWDRVHTRGVPQSSSCTILWDLEIGEDLTYHGIPFRQLPRTAFAEDKNSAFSRSDDRIIQRWLICSGDFDFDFVPVSKKKKITSPPFLFVPAVTHDISSASMSVPERCCYYEGDEWIIGLYKHRILWLPPGRRGRKNTSKCHGKKIAIGIKSGKAYIADFSHVLLPSWLCCTLFTSL